MRPRFKSQSVGLVLSVLSLIIMPVLAYTKQQTGQQMGSEALQVDAVETWVCGYLSLVLLGCRAACRFRLVVGGCGRGTRHAAGHPLAGLGNSGRGRGKPR